MVLKVVEQHFGKVLIIQGSISNYMYSVMLYEQGSKH